MLPWWGKADDLALAHITLARIHLARANINEAVGAVEKATQFIQTRGSFPEARKAVEFAQVNLWLAQGDMQSASRWVASLQARLGSEIPFGFEYELTHIAQARVLIAQNKSNEAIGMLSHLEESAQVAGRKGRHIEILILKALALQATGDTKQADIALTKSLTLAEPEGYMRIFMDEGAPMIQLLARLKTSKLTPQLRAYVNRLLETLAPE